MQIHFLALCLRSEKPGLRLFVESLLQDFRGAEIDELCAALERPNSQLHQDAAELLTRLGRRAARAAPQLLTVINYRHQPSQIAALRALNTIGLGRLRHREALRVLLEERRRVTNILLAAELIRSRRLFHPKNRRADELSRKTEDDVLHSECLAALAEVEQGFDPQALRRWTNCLKTRSDISNTLDSIRGAGLKAVSLADLLADVVLDDSLPLNLQLGAVEALAALGQIGAGKLAELAQTVMLPALHVHIIMVLPEMGQDAFPALDVIVRHLQGEWQDDHEELIALLGRMQSQRALVVKPLLELLAEQDLRKVYLALDALADLYTGAKSAPLPLVHVVLRLIECRDEALQTRAGTALAQMAPGAAWALIFVIAMLPSRRLEYENEYLGPRLPEEVTVSLLGFLEMLGPDAQIAAGAVLQVVEMRNSTVYPQSDRVVGSALDALSEIGLSFASDAADALRASLPELGCRGGISAAAALLALPEIDDGCAWGTMIAALNRDPETVVFALERLVTVAYADPQKLYQVVHLLQQAVQTWADNDTVTLPAFEILEGLGPEGRRVLRELFFE